ncbi:MAG: REP-associated tyrosine transposase [Armatimonadota bacterium]
MGKRFNREDREAVLHYLTLNVRDPRQVLRLDAFARMVLQTLRACCDEYPSLLIAYVVMPEHLHAILNPFDGQLTHFLEGFKSASSLAAKRLAREMEMEELLMWLQNTPDRHAQLWQDGKHSLHLWSDKFIWQKIHYIHSNPVRRQLVRKPNDYPYSSFAAMCEVEGERIIPIDKGFWWETPESTM